MPESTVARIMEPGNLEESIRMSINRALEDAGSPEELGAVLVFNCVARHLVIDTDEAVDILRDQLGEDVPLFGFNCYGEFAPTPSGKLVQHNQTVVAYVIGKETVGRPGGA
ncbi:FIST C-terminal domain-containing protein [Methanopyrus sp.]